MDILIITWTGHQWARDRLKGLWKWHESRGDQPRWSNLRIPQSGYVEHFGTPDVAYVYNGEYREAKPIIAYLEERGTVIKRLEVAWFPQSEYWYFDDKGTNGNSMIYDDPLDWVGEDHFALMHEVIQKHYGGRQWAGDCGEERVLVPLQLDWDTAITKFGKGFRNQKLINTAREMRPGAELIIRPHPKDKSPGKYQLPPGARLQLPGETPLIDAICESTELIGINSTVLLEAALLGAPVTALGQSFLHHPAGEKKVLAALCARQVPMFESDLDQWAAPHLGLAQPKKRETFHLYPAQAPAEFEELCQRVRDQQPQVIMEIGSRHGRSIIRLAEAAMPALKTVIILDLPDGVWGADSKANLLATIEHLKGRGLEVAAYLGDSHSPKAAEFVKVNDAPDFVLIDGDHTIEGVTADWKLAWDNLTEGGSIAFHDIAGDEHHFHRFNDPSGRWAGKSVRIGVPRLWRAIEKSRLGQTETIIDKSRKKPMGIGIITKIKHRPGTVKVTECAPGRR